MDSTGDPVSELKFAGTERRSLTLPLALAVLAMAAALLGWTRYFPNGTVVLEPMRTDVVPTRTVFGSESIVVGAGQTEDELYIAVSVLLRNPLRVPVSVDDLTCTLTDAQGAEMTVSAVGEADLHLVETSFPQLKPMMLKPLLRETTVPAGQVAEGTVLFHFPLTRTVWDARKSASVAVALYHRNPVRVTLPKELDR